MFICVQQAASSSQEKQAANEQEVTQLRANLRQYEQLIEEYRCCILLVFNSISFDSIEDSETCRN